MIFHSLPPNNQPNRFSAIIGTNYPPLKVKNETRTCQLPCPARYQVQTLPGAPAKDLLGSSALGLDVSVFPRLEAFSLVTIQQEGVSHRGWQIRTGEPNFPLVVWRCALAASWGRQTSIFFQESRTCSFHYLFLRFKMVCVPFSFTSLTILIL
jgi:hypothetical protein